MLDSDGDGLTDDMENRLGTNPNDADSDGDGYIDGAEVKDNFNPLGAGELAVKLSPIDQAILEDETLGQPKTEGEISEKFKIENVINIEDEKDATKEGYNLSGTAEANNVITLYIYSDMPLVMTTETDEYGNWKYQLNESLIEGEHEIYVAVNDNTGKIVKKSNPLSFFVKEAKAVSIQDFVSSPFAAERTVTPKSSEIFLKYYILIAIAIIVTAILLFIIFMVQRSINT